MAGIFMSSQFGVIWKRLVLNPLARTNAEVDGDWLIHPGKLAVFGNFVKVLQMLRPSSAITAQYGRPISIQI
jgi:hypothetical protein